MPEDNNRVLVLAPHTDDGEFGCGGTISRLIEEGRQVYYAAFSTAEESVPAEFPPDVLETEAREGTRALGIAGENLLIYKYRVRHLPHVRQEILEELVRLRRDLRPSTVFLPSSHDLHQDHQTVYMEGLRAFKMETVLAYELPWNNISFDCRHFVALQRRHVATKVEALKCYRSQNSRPLQRGGLHLELGEEPRGPDLRRLRRGLRRVAVGPAVNLAGNGAGKGGSRVLTAHQPNYLPWLGLFHRVAQADVWVLADDVPFSKHGYTNRVRVRTADGWQWLTVPVRTRGRGGQQIREVETCGGHWQSKHWRTLEWNYRHSPHFDDFAPFLASFYRETQRLLVDVNVALCEFLRRQLGIEVETRLSSSLRLRRERSERLVDMALSCGCDVYLAGGGGSRRYPRRVLLRRVRSRAEVRRFRASGVPPVSSRFRGQHDRPRPSVQLRNGERAKDDGECRGLRSAS